MAKKTIRIIPALLLGVILFALGLDPGDRRAGAPERRYGAVQHVSRVPGDGLPPRVPNPWFYLERAFPRGKIDRLDWQRAQLQAEILRAEAVSGGDRSGGAWQAWGPTNIGGRMTDIAVDPTDVDLVYAGAAEGGVLRSRDGGLTWTPLFDDQPSLSVGAVALDPSNPSTVYVGTGEVNPGGGSVAYGGAGIFRSLDQGDTWESLGLEESGSIGRIRVDPTAPCGSSSPPAATCGRPVRTGVSTGP